VFTSSLTWTSLPAKPSDEHLPVTDETCFISLGYSHSVYFAKCCKTNSNIKNASDTRENGMEGPARENTIKYIMFVMSQTQRHNSPSIRLSVSLPLFIDLFIYPCTVSIFLSIDL
jgi:hypothetical protein